MTDINYTYTLAQFLNKKVDISKLDSEIRASSITTALSYISATEVVCDCWFKSSLDGEDYTTLSGIITGHDGIQDDIDDLQYVDIRSADVKLNVDLTDEYRDRSGKLRVHQTSRKLGTVICWTGEGDDINNPTTVGGGESLSFVYAPGQNDPLVKYVDFNMLSNETWLHEGYITWKDCHLDTLDLQLVTRTTDFTISSGTNYNLYGGYLIIPAIPGTGTVSVNSDITKHDGGLVYMPLNDKGESQQAFWNADWDVDSRQFVNITPAPSGNGSYNLFAVEIKLAHFVRKMPLLSSGFIALNSSDTDQLGQGMRLKMIADTNTTISGVGDHAWSVACTLCMHRAKTT